MDTITQFVFDFFRLCNLEPMQIRHGVWQVQVGDALMKELDGWRAQGRLLQFTFDKRLAETYGADLISQGSYRLNTIIQVTRKQGLLSHAHVPHHIFHEPSIRKKVLQNVGPAQRAYVVNNSLSYGQYLLLHIAVSQLGLEKNESIHSAIVNLSNGEVLKFIIPPHLVQGGGVISHSIRKRKCSFKKAYANAVAQISAELSEGNLTWTRRARDKLAMETDQLAKFFEGQTTSPEYKAKLQELNKRFAPKIQMDALRGAILYVPVFYYRLVVVETNGKERIQNLYYDPISNLEELE
jgi:hypothetical protein